MFILPARTAERARTSGAVLLTILLAGAGILQIQPAITQTKAPGITASAVRVSPGAEVPLKISISNEQAVPRQAMLVFRALPPGMTFSDGRPFGPGVWVVPVSSAGKLTVRVPANASGEITLSVQLATLDGETLVGSQIALIIEPAPANQVVVSATAAIGAGVSAGTAPARQQEISPEDKAAAQKLMSKAEGYMQNGSIIVARQLFQSAAERGLGEAALALAQTYDPRELARMTNVIGVQPDPAMAKKWYDRARELGASGNSLR